jgi:hypothetical protein
MDIKEFSQKIELVRSQNEIQYIHKGIVLTKKGELENIHNIGVYGFAMAITETVITMRRMLAQWAWMSYDLGKQVSIDDYVVLLKITNNLKIESIGCIGYQGN